MVIVTVIGKDRTGIIFNVSKIWLKTMLILKTSARTVMHDFFTMIMLVDMTDMTVLMS